MMDKHNEAILEELAERDKLELKAVGMHLYDTLHTINKNGWDNIEATADAIRIAVEQAYENGYRSAMRDETWGLGRRIEKVIPGVIL